MGGRNTFFTRIKKFKLLIYLYIQNVKATFEDKIHSYKYNVVARQKAYNSLQ